MSRLVMASKLLIGFDDVAIKAIDEWHREQEDLPNGPESGRRWWLGMSARTPQTGKPRRMARQPTELNEPKWPNGGNRAKKIVGTVR
jgi:hypothetical protein